MKTNMLSGLKLTLLCIVLFAGIYSIVMLGIAYVIAPNRGRGDVIALNGKVVGFVSVGQSFTLDKYFCSRPSAVNYNAAGSAGSNKGPSNPDYLATVKARIDTFLIHNPGVTRAQIPVELVTASGSGLDPHISLGAAKIQIRRIAKTRGIAEEKLQQLVASQLESSWLGIMGPSKVNVLKLNVALDQLR